MINVPRSVTLPIRQASSVPIRVGLVPIAVMLRGEEAELTTCLMALSLRS